MPASTPTITGSGYIKREEFKIFADVSVSGAPEWELQGDKVEDMSIEMNANVEKGTDVTGVVYADLDKYEEQTSVEPYRAKRDNKLFSILFDIVKYRKTLSDVQRKFLCVNVFKNSGGTYDAWTQDCIVEVKSYGGDTKGVAIPYDIHWTGKRTYGTAVITDGTVTFTPESGAAAEVK